MECTVLTALDFRIGAPTPFHFLERLLRANRCDEAHGRLVEYILELALVDYRMARYVPSHLVSAALLLSNALLGRIQTWPVSMVQQARHSEQLLVECAEAMRELLKTAPTAQLQAVRKKYSLQQYSRVALSSPGAL
mmetsp:Transcript_100022/g.180454  ORF Transcript_100022/g.180454 Transcript_100022/m.180454 type:complete len:136 (+) Transcript_100022:922-1329(+)